MKIILIETISAAYQVFQILMFARVISSLMIQTNNRNSFTELTIRITEPFLYPMRELFERYNISFGMLDLSFIATWFAAQILRNVLINVILTIF